MIEAQTAISAWPPAVRAMALPFERVHVDEADHQAMLAAAGGRSAGGLSQGLLDRLDIAREAVGGTAHLRLENGSFKQSGYLPRCSSLPDIRSALLARNPRVESLLQVPGPLYLFPWHDIAPGAEFRLFFKEHQAVGISQMGVPAQADLVAPDPTLASALLGFARELGASLALPNFAADAFVEVTTAALKVTLIEINPNTLRTASGLFCRKKDDFDGTLRLAMPVAPNLTGCSQRAGGCQA